jgi:hypothetical protein
MRDPRFLVLWAMGAYASEMEISSLKCDIGPPRDRALSLDRSKAQYGARQGTALVARTRVDPTLPQVEHQYARLPTRSHFSMLRNKNPARGALDSCLRPRDSAGIAHLPDRAFSLGERRLIDAAVALAASARSAETPPLLNI